MDTKAPPLDGFTGSTSNYLQEKCSLCGNTFSQDMMVQFGEKWICAPCKPNYLQMLQQGLSPAGQMRYGGFWIRVGARVIDTIILQTINYILIFAITLITMGEIISHPNPANRRKLIATGMLQVCVAILAALSYEVGFIGKFRATPGKMLCGLVVVRPDGGRVSYMRALGRYFANGLSGLIFGAGYIMAGLDSEKRALHDRICDTRVIRK